MKKLKLLIAMGWLFALTAQATTVQVSVQNFSFTPASFIINTGDTVKWVLVSGTHTTSSLVIPAGAVAWNAPLNSSALTFIYVPTVIGTYNYQCNIHTSMKGSFTVICPAVTATISAGGPTTFCSGDSVLLSATTTGAPTSFQWKKGGVGVATTATYMAKTTGAYTLTVGNSCGSTNTSNSITLTVNPKPNPVITPSGTTNFCPPALVTLNCSTAPGWKFKWYNGATAITGATTATYVASTAGVYQCKVTIIATGCNKKSNKATLKVVCKTLLSIDDALSISPNPSSSDFTLHLGSVNTDHLTLRIIDETGRLISTEKISGDVTIGSDLDAGIYFIEVIDNNTLINRSKIIKKE